MVVMKKFKWGFMLCLFLGGCLFGCQSAPEEDFVAEKNQEVLESKIGVSNTKESSETSLDSDSYEWETAQYKDSFAGADDNVWIEVDAEATYCVGYSPVIRVKPHTFDSSEVKIWADKLLNADHYYEPKVELPRAEIEEEILNIKRVLGDEEALAEEYNGNQEDMEAAKEILNDFLHQYEIMYETAPEAYERRETDWEFRPFSYYDELDALLAADDSESADLDEQLVIESEGEEEFGRIIVYNYRDGDYYDNKASFTLYNDYDEYGNAAWNANKEIPMELDEAEVIQMVQEALEGLGLDHMVLESYSVYGKAGNSSGGMREKVTGSDQEAYYYSLLFLPSYEGLGMIRQNSIYEYPEDSYGALYDYEKLYVSVKSDKITAITWNAPTEVVSVENLKVGTISFDEVKTLFKNQMQIEYTIGKLSRQNPSNDDYNQVVNQIVKGEIHVDQIDYGYVRIQIQNNDQEFRLVPAWSLKGEEALDYGEGYTWPSEYPELNPESLREVYQTINAVDGSFINVRLGY